MNKKILIIGGLGFIGKNLFLRLIQEGFFVKIVSQTVENSDDGFPFTNYSSNFIKGSTLDEGFLNEVVKGYDVIYSLAGSSGAPESIKRPFYDLDTNLRGHLNLLEACKKNNQKALLVFPSSRLVYGKPETIPVSENHPIRPESIYAIHKITTEQYYLLYQRLYGIKSIIFRIGNPYGPFQKFGGNHYGILNWFIHDAVLGKEITIYGDGTQMRDFIHVEDVVDIFRLSIDKIESFGQVFNLGSGNGVSIREVTMVIKKNIPSAKIKFIPWPELDKKIETGDYISDIGALQRKMNWSPSINIEEGIKKTIDFYKFLK